MQHAIKNIGTSSLIFGSSLEIINGFPYIMYDSSTYVVSSVFDDLVSSMSSTDADKTKNLNYCLMNGLAAYCEDGVTKPNAEFYGWFSKFNDNYTLYKQYLAQGIVNLGIDNTNNRITIGSRALTVDDLPNNIPATHIANGSVSDAEFVTLDGINTSTTIQKQLDGKLGVSTPRNFVYTQVTASTLWTVNHGLLSLAVIPVIYDTAGNELLATITIIDSSTLSARFSVPTTGTCVVSY